jgi:cell division septal protein FtsQ
MELDLSVKKRRRKYWRRLYFWGTVSATALLLLVAAASFPWLSRQVTRWASSFHEHRYFSVREIKVSGGERIGGSEIVAMAGLSHGMNLWNIDSRKMEARISRHPWVKRVLIRREFPHRVVIEVEERAPRGIVALGKLYYVDADGVIFDQVHEGDKVDFPFVSGVPQIELAAQPHALRQKLREAFSLSDLMSKSFGPVSEIHFLHGGGLVLYPTAPAIALHMGWGEWPEKITQLERVLAQWKGKEGHLAALDVSFRQQVVVQLKATSHG